MSIGEILAIASALVSLGGLIANQRWQATEIARVDREIEHLRAWRHKVGENPTWAVSEQIVRLDDEVERLREWHHKIGDNPTERWVQALDVLADRINRIDKRDT